MSDDNPNVNEGADGDHAKAAPETTREDMQAQLQRHIEAASQLQSIKRQTTGSLTFKARNVDPAMRPTLQPGDILEIGGVSPMRLRPNDLVYFRVSGDEYRVRKVIRRRNDLTDLAFIVSDEAGNETTITDVQVFGRVVAYERDGQQVKLVRTGTSIDTSDWVHQTSVYAKDLWNRILEFFKRKSGR